MADRPSSIFCDSSLWLLLAIAASWVGVAQLARSAEKVNGALQQTSIVHLMTWANATAWIILAVPHAIRKSKETKDESMGWRSSLTHLVTTDVFQCRHAFQFLALALATNYAYIGALHFLPASLNTAVFCTSPVFTLMFSVVWLSPSPSDAETQPGILSLCRSLCTWQGMAVVLSLAGVVCIAEPWQTSTSHMSATERLCGVGLALAAALGTATYQVYFKATFGDRMQADEVGLFLSYMGTLIFVIGGVILACMLRSGVYPLQLGLVPWGHVVSTSLSSAIFNFLIKFGLSRDTPVAISLATQIGIPLNLMIDVLIVGARISGFQVLGTILMLLAFSLQRGPSCCPTAEKDVTTVAAGGGAREALVGSGGSAAAAKAPEGGGAVEWVTSTPASNEQ